MRRGELIDERFQIEERVGTGGMGSVYRAFDRMTGTNVALKTLDGGHFNARFAREARVLASLIHPAVVRYVAHGALPSGELYLAMEWLEGEDLSGRLRRSRLTPAEGVLLTARIAEGLAAAHAIGLV